MDETQIEKKDAGIFFKERILNEPPSPSEQFQNRDINGRYQYCQRNPVSTSNPEWYLPMMDAIADLRGQIWIDMKLQQMKANGIMKGEIETT